MKVSLNWLKDYLQMDLEPSKIGEILTEIGLEVEGEEVVDSIPGGLKGVVVGHVLTCQQHPNADRLSLTTVDLGQEEPVQIVCGAPNVAQGQKVLVATVGTQLFPLGSETALVIKKGKIRGEVSQGMICAEDELGLGTDHDGIMVLS
ncbi:MAG: phenylalanine--tRNA ligase subunit beta, partial [Saprospiraceae bacterium]|nr:phenylalanine--tRNA ligase subunit beta [Saprospiraceae bacterium]